MACSIIVKQLVIALNTTRTNLLVHLAFTQTFFSFASRMNAERNASVSHNTDSHEFNALPAVSQETATTTAHSPPSLLAKAYHF